MKLFCRLHNRRAAFLQLFAKSKSMRLILSTLTCLLVYCTGIYAQRINIIPQPASIEERTGDFYINDKTKIIDKTGDSLIAQTIQLFINELSSLTNIHLHVDAGVEKNSISIYINPNKISNAEGYELQISKDNIIVTAATAAGILYAFESLKQLLPADLNTTVKQYAIPCCLIKDSPQYAYRGMHLDVSRHFFTPALIKQYLDILAVFKINVFHWHLTDSHGWRLEIKQYPKLTSIGAWRADRTGIPMTIAKPTQPGEPATYGGFYTQEEVKDIIAYAAQRNITIIPEIEMPGHCTAAIIAYPQYGDLNNPVPLLMPCGYEGDLKHNFCAGYDSTYIFLENILKEVMALFPSKYIHIGGDEVRPEPWMKCPRCQEKMQEKGLTTAKQLQAYFTSRIDSFITANGKAMMGWDEITGADIAKTSVSMSWHGESKASEAANKGNATVMTPYWYTYFDFYQSDPQLEPDITYARLQLDSVYQFNPMPVSFTGERQKFILGGQGCLWTENIPTPQRVEYMLLPRLLALSEALWTPATAKNYKRFIEKTELQFRRFDRQGINYARSMYNVNSRPLFDSSTQTVKLTLTNQTYQYPIHYTTDETKPTSKSALYAKPVDIIKSSIVKTATFKNGEIISKINTDTIVIHKAFAASIKMSPANESSTRLIDGILGTVEPYDHRWVIITDSVTTIIVDVKKQQLLHSFSMRFMEEPVGNFYLPKSLAVSISADGINYQTSFTINNIDKIQELRHVTTFNKILQQQARFIKVEIHNASYNKIADQNIMMMDEIIIE